MAGRGGRLLVLLLCLSLAAGPGAWAARSRGGGADKQNSLRRAASGVYQGVSGLFGEENVRALQKVSAKHLSHACVWRVLHVACLTRCGLVCLARDCVSGLHRVGVLCVPRAYCIAVHCIACLHCMWVYMTLFFLSCFGLGCCFRRGGGCFNGCELMIVMFLDPLSRLEEGLFLKKEREKCKYNLVLFFFPRVQGDLHGLFLSPITPLESTFRSGTR